jgi:hypothetical protein
MLIGRASRQAERVRPFLSRQQYHETGAAQDQKSGTFGRELRSQNLPPKQVDIRAINPKFPALPPSGCDSTGDPARMSESKFTDSATATEV